MEQWEKIFALCFITAFMVFQVWHTKRAAKINTRERRESRSRLQRAEDEITRAENEVRRLQAENERLSRGRERTVTTIQPPQINLQRVILGRDPDPEPQPPENESINGTTEERFAQNVNESLEGTIGEERRINPEGWLDMMPETRKDEENKKVKIRPGSRSNVSLKVSSWNRFKKIRTDGV